MFGRAGCSLGAADQPALPAASALATNVFHPVSPGPIDGQIATATAYMLTNYHYLKKPFDEAVSSQFLDRYLETLDPQHIHFTQADLAEFEHYRTNLNHLTLPEPASGRHDARLRDLQPVHGAARAAHRLRGGFAEA